LPGLRAAKFTVLARCRLMVFVYGAKTNYSDLLRAILGVNFSQITPSAFSMQLTCLIRKDAVNVPQTAD
jgi:hypothetical protein